MKFLRFKGFIIFLCVIVFSAALCSLSMFWNKDKIDLVIVPEIVQKNEINIVSYDYTKLKYMLRSVEKNMNWVEHIYIVCDSAFYPPPTAG